jgi:hypothetical protein
VTKQTRVHTTPTPSYFKLKSLLDLTRDVKITPVVSLSTYNKLEKTGLKKIF